MSNKKQLQISTYMTAENPTDPNGVFAITVIKGRNRREFYIREFSLLEKFLKRLKGEDLSVESPIDQIKLMTTDADIEKAVSLFIETPASKLN